LLLVFAFETAHWQEFLHLKSAHRKESLNNQEEDLMPSCSSFSNGEDGGTNGRGRKDKDTLRHRELSKL
jgi:hypothetical protein